MKVTLLTGANAYACIETDGRKTDIRLSPGKSAWASLRKSADEYRQEASRKRGMADLCDKAADVLMFDRGLAQEPASSTDLTLETTVLSDGTEWGLCLPGGGDTICHMADHLPATEQEFWANRIKDALDRFEPADTPPALFPMSEIHVEAALCLWEAALDLRCKPHHLVATEDLAAKDALDALFLDHGTCAMRHAIMHLAPECDAAWNALGADEQDQAVPYDWEFVPRFLCEQITSGRLLLAVMAQY